MPTTQELFDLGDKCDWTWTEKEKNGVINGWVVRGRGEYSSNSIFLPCSGDSHSDYWSSVPESGGYCALGLSFGLFHLEGSDADYDYNILLSCCNPRYFGQAVRPVKDVTE